MMEEAIDQKELAFLNQLEQHENEWVAFIEQDALKVDVSQATVVTLYLLSSSNLKLRPILTRQLKPGARIVSHAFSMGDWEPLKQETLSDGENIGRTIYLCKADGVVRP